jgi:hypothetical protein
VQPFPPGRRKNGTMCESQTASNYSSDTDLPKFEAAELRRVLELLESLAVTEPQKIARSHRLSRLSSDLSDVSRRCRGERASNGRKPYRIHVVVRAYPKTFPGGIRLQIRGRHYLDQPVPQPSSQPQRLALYGFAGRAGGLGSGSRAGEMVIPSRGRTSFSHG